MTRVTSPKRRSLFLLAALLGLLSGASAFGQGTATLKGRITDPSGAVVPGATITATETKTSFARSSTTSEDGYFSIPLLRPAEYKVSIEAAGFKRYEQAGVQLVADQTATLNAVVELGVATEAITVEGGVNQVDLQTPTLKGVIDERRINELPLNGRNAALALLVAGVSETPADGATQCCDKTFPGAVSYSSNGGLQNTINFKLDGAENMDGYTNVNQPFPFPDVLQEFSVQTSNYGADLGNQSGGAVNIITKSGTNDLHGNLFGYLRNEVFNARNFFTPERDKLKRSQFGGTAGGPLLRDKTFWFVGFQSTELRNIQSAAAAIVPTAANMRGDFSALLDANHPENALGRRVQLVDPDTGQPFPLNIIPTARFDPVAMKILSFIPQAGTTPGFGRFFYPRPIRNDEKSLFVRMDHMLGSNDRLAGRYYFSDYDEASTYDGSNILTLNPAANLRSQNILLHETHTFRPNLISDIRLSYGRVYSIRQRPKIEGFTAEALGVVQRFLPETGETFGFQVRPNFFSVSNTNSLWIARNNYALNEDVKWIKGRHNVSFGGMVQQNSVRLGLPASIPFMRFENDATGYAIANFFLGKVNLFNQANEQQRFNEGWFPSLYIQDDLRLSPRFSISLGMRWDPYLTWGSPSGQVLLFSIPDALAGRKSQVFVNAPPGLFYPGDPNFPKNGAKGDHNNFAPRLGFAYDLTGDGKTSLRGGAGLFYDQRPPAITFNQFQGIFPWSAGFNVVPPPGPFSDPLRGYSIPDFEFPPTRNAPFTGRQPGGNSLEPFDKAVSPMTYNWNLTIERQLVSSTLFRIAYVGSRTNYIGVPIEANPAVYIPGSTLPVQARRVFPEIGSVFYTSQSVNSSYHGMQTGVEKRFGKSGDRGFFDGITLLANYTWSRAMDGFPPGADPTGNTGGSDTSGLSFYDPRRLSYDYGPARGDRTHRFVASYLWDLPQLKGANAFLRNVLGGWQTTGIYQIQSGLSLTVYAGVDRSQQGLNNQDRVDYLGGNPFGAGGCRPGEAPCVDFLNPAAFGLPALGQAGNTGKGFLRGPNFSQWDIGLLKNFQASERWRIQFRAEFFNVLNHTNFIPLHGQNQFTYSGSGFGGIRSAGDPRIGQLALKIFF